jgi:hypothetical protein
MISLVVVGNCCFEDLYCLMLITAEYVRLNFSWSELPGNTTYIPHIRSTYEEAVTAEKMLVHRASGDADRHYGFSTPARMNAPASGDQIFSIPSTSIRQATAQWLRQRDGAKLYPFLTPASVMRQRIDCASAAAPNLLLCQYQRSYSPAEWMH